MFIDLIVLFALFIICFLLSVYIDAFEWLHETAMRYEQYEFDEFITASIIMVVLFAVFSYRRWQDVRKLSHYCERLSMIDPITMLPNRRLISIILDDIRQGKTHNHSYPLSLILIDISGLEQIQQQFGHAVAEQVVHELVYRYGLLMRADQLISYRNAYQCLLFCPQFSENQAAELCQQLLSIELENRKATLQLLNIQAVSVTMLKANQIDCALERLEDLLHARQFNVATSA